MVAAIAAAAVSRRVAGATLGAAKARLPQFASIRAMSSDGHHDEKPGPILIGPGAKPGRVPSLLEQSTGVARYQLICQLEGRRAFDNGPLELEYKGTSKRPIIIKSTEDIRIVGCTGFPKDTHSAIFIGVTRTKGNGVDRCPDCGNCFQLERYEIDLELNERAVPAGTAPPAAQN